MLWTDGTQSPELFRVWSAVSTIAGALERKVWIKAGKRQLFPNLYVLLVAAPGVGKTDAIRAPAEFWGEIPSLHVAPRDVSKAGLVDAVAEAERQLLRPQADEPLVKFNHLNIAADELGVFLTQYESAFMSTLNSLFDGMPYKEKKRSIKTALEIPKPLFNMIAGTTPAWLGGNLPDTAWAEGFSSRLVLVSSGEKIKIKLFEETPTDDILKGRLAKDLNEIHHMYGQFSWAPDVAEAMQAWYELDCPPVPEHPKLEHYLPRRHIHFMKLLMVFSAARSSDMILRMEDYQMAMDLFLMTESQMPDVFRAMKSIHSDSNVIDECFAWIYQNYTKDGKPISEHRIIHFLAQRMPSYNVSKVLQIMLDSRIIEIAAIGAGVGGRNTYKPVPRPQHGD